MELRSSLGRVRGYGPNKEGGVGHWWAERLAAIGLVPLTLWFIFSAVMMTGADLAHFKAWVGAYGNPVLLILFTIGIYYHGQMGLTVIIEDYIHHEAANLIVLVLVKLGAFFFATYTIFCILRLTFGA